MIWIRDALTVWKTLTPWLKENEKRMLFNLKQDAV